MNRTTENTIEQTALEWLESLGYDLAHGPDISPDGDPARQERAGYGDVVLAGRLRAALERLNPDLPGEVLDEAVRKVTRTDSPSLIENNRRFHRMLTDRQAGQGDGAGA